MALEDQANVKIINNNNNSDLCFVFFSSNGLINGKKTKEYIIENDYYEFINICNNPKIRNISSKILLLRDLELNFYVNGINEAINSIDKMIELIKVNTKNKHIIAAGYSGGGYMAILISLFLDNVIKVFSFGGVLNLYSWKGSLNDTSFLENTSLVEASKILSKSKYFNLLPFLSRRCHPSIFHFYGNKSKSDLLVLEEFKNYQDDKIFFIGVDSDKHGGLLNYFDYISIFTSKDSKMIKLSKYKHLSRKMLSMKMQGLLNYLMNIIRTYIWQKRKG